MKRRALLAGAGAVGAALLAGCGGGDDSDENVAEVVAENDAFDPLRLSIDPGTEVRWVNQDGYVHTVTDAQFHDKAREWSFDENMGQDETLSYQFDETGIYEYRSKFEGEDNMCGAVLVGDVSLDASLPCE